MDVVGYTKRIVEWVETRFGKAIMQNRHERTIRVLEEAIELAQAEGITFADADKLTKRVYSRPAGHPRQEVAGIGVTLLAYCACTIVDFDLVMEQEIMRIEEMPWDHFRKKQQEKADAGVAMKPER